MPTDPTPTDTLADQPISTLDAANNDAEPSTIDRLTGTTAEDRTALFNEAKDKLSGAVTSALDAVKGNPKTAAAIAAGATAAVAGAAYGATKLNKNGGAKRATTTPRRSPAKRTPATKK